MSWGGRPDAAPAISGIQGKKMNSHAQYEKKDSENQTIRRERNLKDARTKRAPAYILSCDIVPPPAANRAPKKKKKQAESVGAEGRAGGKKTEPLVRVKLGSVGENDGLALSAESTA